MIEDSKFIPPSPLKTPVLFLIFNRLETTKKVFEEIRKAKPPKLYIASDGPREYKVGELEKVKAVRDYVLNNIDWNCEIKTLFREKNLGCGRAVSEAITWFFENEEMGIILEDDCLPSQSFFWFCEEILKRYKDDMRIWHIGGCNFQDGKKRGEGDYYFSAINHVWGWASWANRWKYYNFELKNINDDKFIENYWKGSALRYWKYMFWKMKKLEIDTWDYQWTFTMWYYKGLAILPNVNLISNIGFGQDATHAIYEDKKVSNLTIQDLVLNQHPSKIERNTEADIYTYYRNFHIPVWVRLRGSISKVIPKKIKNFIKRKLI
jgi:hypothetical protein